jgi:hypothetical protein
VRVCLRVCVRVFVFVVVVEVFHTSRTLLSRRLLEVRGAVIKLDTSDGMYVREWVGAELMCTMCGGRALFTGEEYAASHAALLDNLRQVLIEAVGALNPVRLYDPLSEFVRFRTAFPCRRAASSMCACGGATYVEIANVYVSYQRTGCDLGSGTKKRCKVSSVVPLTCCCGWCWCWCWC